MVFCGLCVNCGLSKVFSWHINIFGCHCRPCTPETGHVSNLCTYYCLYVFCYWFICRTLNLIICCSSIVVLGPPLSSAGLWSVNYVKLVAFEFELYGVVYFVLTEGCYFLFFCSEEEVISVHSSPEVVEVPPPSPKVVGGISTTPQKGAQSQAGMPAPGQE